jgi:26S proteasome regulatory subunit N5
MVKVETYGSMDKKEKVEFLLAQIQLLIDVNDLSKAGFYARKVNPKTFEDKALDVPPPSPPAPS